MNGANVYRIFMLRLWQEDESPTSEPAPLRIVLEEPHSGERLSFASLAALLTHLEEAVQPQPESSPALGGTTEKGLAFQTSDYHDQE
jgi:hypothetical protein